MCPSGPFTTFPSVHSPSPHSYMASCRLALGSSSVIQQPFAHASFLLCSCSSSSLPRTGLSLPQTPLVPCHLALRLYSFFKNLCFLIGGKLPYNFVLVSAIQQHESVYIYIYPFHPEPPPYSPSLPQLYSFLHKFYILLFGYAEF